MKMVTISDIYCTIPDPELGVREGGDNGDNERNFTRYYR